MTRTEELAKRLTDLRDRRGLSPELVNRLWSIGDPSLVDDLERASGDDIAAINSGHAQAMDFERSMRKVEDVPRESPEGAIARLRALADELTAPLGDTPTRAY